MTRWIVFAGLTALIVTGYFATFYAHGKSFWRSVRAVPAGLEVRIFLGIHHDGMGAKMRPILEDALTLLDADGNTLTIAFMLAYLLWINWELTLIAFGAFPREPPRHAVPHALELALHGFHGHVVSLRDLREQVRPLREQSAETLHT